MKRPGLWYSVFVIVLSFGVIMIPTLLWKVKIQPLFILSWIIGIPMCMNLGYSFKDIQHGMIEHSQKSLQPIIFILCVGAMTGVWNICGTVPEITRIGLSIIKPEYFLPSAFLFCMLFAFISGTAFGTCGTVGAALMGMAAGFSIDLAHCAGAIVTGTYFGYMISPVSDAENLLCGLLERDIMMDVKYQMIVVIPSALICLIIYYFIGSAMENTAGHDSIREIALLITHNFKAGIINLFPIIVVIIMILVIKSTLISVLGGIASGIAVSIIYQKNSIISTIESMWFGPSLISESDFIREVFNNGGMKSMSDVVILFIMAFGLIGMLHKCGIVNSVISIFENKISGRLSATFYTVIISFIANFMSASSIASIVITVSMLMPVYEKEGLDRGDFARAVSIGGIICTLVIPWHSNAMNSASLLGIDSMLMISVMFAPMVAVLSVFVIQGFSLDKKIKRKFKKTMVS